MVPQTMPSVWHKEKQDVADLFTATSDCRPTNEPIGGGGGCPKDNPHTPLNQPRTQHALSTNMVFAKCTNFWEHPIPSTKVFGNIEGWTWLWCSQREGEHV